MIKVRTQVLCRGGNKRAVGCGGLLRGGSCIMHGAGFLTLKGMFFSTCQSLKKLHTREARAPLGRVLISHTVPMPSLRALPSLPCWAIAQARHRSHVGHAGRCHGAPPDQRAGGGIPPHGHRHRTGRTLQAGQCDCVRILLDLAP